MKYPSDVLDFSALRNRDGPLLRVAVELPPGNVSYRIDYAFTKRKAKNKTVVNFCYCHSLQLFAAGVFGSIKVHFHLVGRCGLAVEVLLGFE